MEDAKLPRQYGRPNPEVNENETSARLMDVERPGSSKGESTVESSSGDGLGSERSRKGSLQLNDSQTISPKSSSGTRSTLLGLSNELIDLIFTFLSPRDLEKVGCTCRLLYQISIKSHVWYRHVQENVPGCKLESPAPFSTWRELYRSHDSHWFLSKYMIWFSDYFLTGKLILIRYNPKTACMEGYRLVATRKVPEFEHWEFDNEVIIHSFSPRVQLHLNISVLELTPNHASYSSVFSPSNSHDTQIVQLQKRSVAESSVLALQTPSSGHRRFLTFELCRIIPDQPYMSLWPPSTIPAPHRVRNSTQSGFLGSGHRPTKLSEISDMTFRLRTWMNAAGPHSPIPGLRGPIPGFRSTFGVTGQRISEDVETFATLEPKLYASTPLKPYRGLWVGDYSGHGCEFLLMHQPDDEDPFEESRVVQREDETPAEFQIRREEERIYRGSIKAIKLTGDPNVARGEYTFIADDIGAGGFVRYADENKFKGARIVRSRGHVAEVGGGDDRYIETQLILISRDTLAQYWVGFGHISFYERVHIEQLLNPANDPEPERSTWSISEGSGGNGQHTGHVYP